MSAGRTALCMAVLLSACGGNRETTPVEGGRIEGRVRFLGDVSIEPTRIDNTTDPEVCGESQTLEDVALSGDGGVANVIVAIRDAPPHEAPPMTLVLDNVGCRFEPHAAVATAGSTIEAKNSDATLHTTHLYGPAEMNISLPLQGVVSSRALEKTGIYSVKCDVHGWMQAYIRVDDHPYHAVTDARGAFRIEGVPPGTYTLEVWHERLGPMEHEVTVPEAGDALVDIEYSP